MKPLLVAENRNLARTYLATYNLDPYDFWIVTNFDLLQYHLRGTMDRPVILLNEPRLNKYEREDLRCTQAKLIHVEYRLD
jgi:hypothetical protein